MNHTSTSHPREVLTYLGYTLSYLMTAISGIVFSSALLNTLLPERGGYTPLGYYAVYSWLGMLVTSYIVFMIMVRVVIRLVRNEQTAPDHRVRTWILSLGQFIGFLVLAITLATTVRYFFAGEMTLRFMLKSLVVLLVGMDAIFFFRHEMTRTATTNPWISRGVSLGGIIIIGALTWGTFSYLGTPATIRALRLDEQRLSDIQTINSMVTSWYQAHATLPVRLEELALQDYSWVPRDPQTHEPYTYTVRNQHDLTYSLCGTFHFSRDIIYLQRKTRALEGEQPLMRSFIQPARIIDENSSDKATSAGAPATEPDTLAPDTIQSWNYQAGYSCFSGKVDAKLYPPFNTKPTS